MNRKYFVPTFAIAALALASAAGISAVTASDNTSYPAMVQKLAEKFNLNESDVESVFNEEKRARQEEMRKIKEERLNEAVNDGVITEAQKKALLSKWQELQQKREQERQELQDWLDEQGIDETNLATYIGFGHHGRFGGMGMGMMH